MQRLLKVACLLLLVAACSGPPRGKDAEVGRRTATIEGVVREADTEVPIAGVSVFLIRTSNQPQIHTTSDADGHFVLKGLEAGRHLVALVRDGYVVRDRQEISGYPFRVTGNQSIRNVVFHMIPAGTLSGRVFNPDGKPANRVEVQLLQRLYVLGHPQWSAVNRGGSGRTARVETNVRGEFRALGVDPGNYVLRLVPHEVTIESVVPGATSVAPLFYPGVRDVSKAATVEVKPGRETLLDDLTLRNEKRGWIRVAVINKSGEPLDGLGTWKVGPPDWVGPEYVLSDDRVVNSYHEIQPDSPGTYDIVATWPTLQGPLAGKVRVQYRGADVDVRMVISKPESKLTGHIVMRGPEETARPLTGVEVAIGPAVSYVARSGPDGALTLPEVYPGTYQLGYIRGLPADTFVESVRQSSRDVFRDGIRIESGEATLDVVVRPGAGILQGTVINTEGQPVQNALVALVPQLSLKERTDYYGAYESIRTDQKGEFELHGITPGTYRAYSWIDAPASGFRNAEFMKPFDGEGTPVELDRGARLAVKLRALDVEP